MNLKATLTKRENQIASMLAVGEPKKIIADKLYISEHTVSNTARNIYEKAEVNSVGQLSTWWFCRRFNLSLSEVYSYALATFFMCLVCVNEFNTKSTVVRAKARTSARAKSGKRKVNIS